MFSLRFILYIILSAYSVLMSAQRYDTWWNEVHRAIDDDLPRTAQQSLALIEAEALERNDASQLLAATLTSCQLAAELSPDSADSKLRLLRSRAAAVSRPVERALWDAALAKVLSRRWGDEQLQEESRQLWNQIFNRPEALHAVAAADCLPLFVLGPSSWHYGNDLLHVLLLDALNNAPFSEEQRRTLASHFADFYSRRGYDGAALLLSLRYGDAKALAPQYAHLPIGIEAYIQQLERMPLSSNAEISAAVGVAHDALRLYSSHPRANWLRNFVTNLSQPSLRLSSERSCLYPGVPQTFSLSANGISSLQWLCFEAERPEMAHFIDSDASDKPSLPTDVAPLFVAETQLPSQSPWLNCDTTFTLTFPHPGKFLCFAVADGEVLDRFEVTVSRLRPLLLTQTGAPTRILALDASRGNQLFDFSVAEYDAKGRLKALFHPDADGAVFIQPAVRTNHRYAVVAEGDSVSPHFYLYRNERSSAAPAVLKTVFLTDRAIYRMGQRVQFGGTLFSVDATTAKVQPLATHAFTVSDVQGRTIARLQVTTDKNGDFNGDFLLPGDVRPGFCQVRSEQGNVVATFRIEAYVRPTFNIELQSPKCAYTYGDTLHVGGTVVSLSGASLAGAVVHYRLKPAYAPWRSSSSATTFHGAQSLDSDGSFRIPVCIPQPSSSQPLPLWHSAAYLLEADVVSPFGEVQSASLRLTIAARKAFLSAQLPSVLLRENSVPLRIVCRNAADVLLRDTLTYRIYDAQRREVFSSSVKSGVAFMSSAWASLPDGRYALEVPQSGADTLRQEFLLIGKASTRPLPDTPFFYHSVASQHADSLTILCGTSFTDATIFCDETDENGRIVAHRSYLVSDTLMCLNFACDASRGRGFRVHISMLRDGVLHPFSERVVAPPPADSLQLRWERFRNLSSPGATEEWTLRLVDSDGRPVAASLCATLYDASLEAFVAHRWSCPSAVRRSLLYTTVATAYDRYFHFSATRPSESLAVPPLQFTSWNPRLFSYHAVMSNASLGETSMRLGGATPRMQMAKAAASTDHVLHEAVVMTEKAVEISESEKLKSLRSDFAETAYFCAAKEMDADGRLTLRFTLPEAVTTWRFMALAHDENMRWTMLTDTLRVQKRLMLQSSVPQFVYEGDSLTLPLTLTNPSEDIQRGEVEVSFADASTGNQLASQLVPFEVGAGKSSVLSVSWTVPLGVERVEVRCLAQTPVATDGEMRSFEVRSQRVEQVVSLPFSFAKPGTHRLDISHLWSTSAEMGKPRLAVKLTPDALREVLSSLYVLTADDSPTADACARRYYAASMALWLKQLHGLTNDSVRTALHRRQTEDFKRLCVLAHPDGGWAWLPGMNPNFSVTTEVAMLLARASLTMADVRADSLLQTALPMLNEEVAVRVAHLRKVQPTLAVNIDNSLLRYLQLAALLRLPVTADVDFLLQRAQSLGKQLTLYGRAVMVSVARYGGDEARAALHLKSLREHAVQTPEMGMYFDSYRAQRLSDSYRISTQVAALEAFAQVGDTLTVSAMRQWLLQSKRTQHWTTSALTADVVHALVSTDSAGVAQSLSAATHHNIVQWSTVDDLDTDSAIFALYADGRMLRADEMLLAPQCATHIEFRKSTPGLSWGSVVATFTLPQSQVQAQGSGLHVEQRWEVERNGKWEPLEASPEVADDEGLSVAVGQRLRRLLVVKAERDFDFVELSAPRAAALQPLNLRSGYSRASGLPAYCAYYDGITRWYVEKMPKGTHTFTETLLPNRPGIYSNGVPFVVCTYAPEFCGNAAATEVVVR